MAGRPEVIGLPRFIFGQSMGGAVALKALLKAPEEWDGILLVAPMCRVIQYIILNFIAILFQVCSFDLDEKLWILIS